ncbi:MAG TPA: aminoacyl-tRNA hydrolase [Desulfovibrio sp.]|nr:aminoacyl-tRNA hydrolase [Desulfovibrio sp.]
MTPKGILAGLGNPGEQYRETRHNYGFFLLDHVLGLAATRKSMRLSPVQESGDALAWSATLGGAPWILVKPLTYMNKSGLVVARYARRHGLGPESVIVAHDELDLPLGRMKLKRGGSSAGHNGVESVISELGSPDFWRLRLGIGRPLERRDMADWVLEPFAPVERETTRLVLPAAWKGLDLFLRRGEAPAVQFLNGFSTEEKAGKTAMDSVSEP